MIKVKIISKKDQLPTYATPGASGMDLMACIDETITMKPGDRELVPTGIFIELPLGYEAQVRGRSGIGFKNGVGLPNGIGTIDSDYRGEIKVSLINWGKEDFVIKDGDRIAQLIVAKYETIQWEQVSELSDSDRGTQGFGHTGR